MRLTKQKLRSIIREEIQEAVAMKYGREKPNIELRKLNYGGSYREFVLQVSYDQIVDVLGEPHIEEDPYKVDAAWHVEDVNSGRKLAVWNYKNGPTYTGEGSVEDIYYWSASGDESLASDLGLY